MRTEEREIYVISDLHVGGRYAERGRGFRICPRKGVEALASFVGDLRRAREAGRDIELCIAGDFVDFLSEEHEGQRRFIPFIADQTEAARVLRTVIERDQLFFTALAELLAAGGRVTILLGNHDVELSLPLPRRVLVEALTGGEPRRLAFLYDGEAYVVGDALIEHGNRYDGFNVIDHDALRRTRSALSRNQSLDPKEAFSAPPGSVLVAEIMNPIKERFPFVDLLKPETETVLPLLLALDPRYKKHIVTLWSLQREARKRAPRAPARPARASDIASAERVRGARGADMGGGSIPGRRKEEAATATVGSADLASLLTDVMSAEDARAFAADIDPAQRSADIASVGETVGALAPLLLARDGSTFGDRLPALQKAIRVVHGDRSFERGVETVADYLDAARALAEGGFRYVVFGHTHLAKDIDLGDGKRYLNTGTWAELVQFPPSLSDPKNKRSIDDLGQFAEDLAAGRFGSFIQFRPTYVRLLLRGEHVVDARLVEAPI